MSGLLEDLVARLERVEAELAELKRTDREVTVPEFAAAHSLHENTVRAAIKDGRLACKRYGRTYRIPRNAEIKPRRVAAADAQPASFADQVLARGGRS